MSSVIVHYGELGLKGRNRPWFIRTLLQSIRNATQDLDVRDVRLTLGRIVIALGPDVAADAIRERLRWLPGIGNFSIATHVAPDIQAMGDAIAGSLEGRGPQTFRITARRADKRFPLSSPDVERTIGRRVQDATGWRVDLSHPELTIRIEILTNDAFFYFDKEPGAGGLPLGTSGKVLCLLSGGIDSPVAAWRMIRRGCRSHFVHFHSYPILSNTSQEKARALVQRLTRGQLRSRLFLVPFGAIQQQVVVSVPPPVRVVIYRRLMMRIADRLARKTKSHALVTGESLGQVASQTIENLNVIGSVTTLPILRPLIGFDKEEITAEAQRLGTYETSIVPDEDCCTLFTPRFPTTRAAPDTVEKAERELDLETLVERAVKDAAIEDFRFPEKTRDAVILSQPPA